MINAGLTANAIANAIKTRYGNALTDYRAQKAANAIKTRYGNALTDYRAQKAAQPNVLLPARSSQYGGAVYGGGGGGQNRYDYTQEGGGLWSIGINPTDYATAQNWYNSQPANVRSDVDRYWTNNRRSGNTAWDISRAVDWRQRDVARKIQKENGFFSTLPGQIVGAGLTLGAGALGGPLVGAMTGAALGGAQGGWRGALLGGAASAIAPALKLPGLSTIASAPVQAARSVATQLANPLAFGRQVASMGVGGIRKR